MKKKLQHMALKIANNFLINNGPFSQDILTHHIKKSTAGFVLLSKTWQCDNNNTRKIKQYQESFFTVTYQNITNKKRSMHTVASPLVARQHCSDDKTLRSCFFAKKLLQHITKNTSCFCFKFLIVNGKNEGHNLC